MNWEHRGELRADPGIAPGDRNIDPPKRRSIWPSIAVVAAAAAFGGVIWFAYQNGRDANRSGPPPLVKADSGPVKVKPDNPGGQEIPFQDSTVYDRLNQNGQKPVVEKLLPPTEEPVARPQTGAVDAAPANAPPAPAQTSGAAADTAAAVAPPPAKQVAAKPTLVTQPVTITPAPQITGGVQVTDTASPTALAPTPGSIITQPAAAPAKSPVAVQAKPVPAKNAAPTSIAALIGNASEPPPANQAAASGSYRLQLSAVRSPDAVAGEWARLKHRFPELASLKNSSSKVEVTGKGTFYRLEAGPLNQASAKSTCTRLRTEGLGCIVVKP